LRLARGLSAAQPNDMNARAARTQRWERTKARLHYRLFGRAVPAALGIGESCAEAEHGSPRQRCSITKKSMHSKCRPASAQAAASARAFQGRPHCQCSYSIYPFPARCTAPITNTAFAQNTLIGASGSGTIALGTALAARLSVPHWDADTFFWLPTDPPFTITRPRTERLALLQQELPVTGS
jgi:hypothetical protein